jgi:hypothetical protein
LFIKERYRLELKWDSIERVNGIITNVHNARFCGPALRIAHKIQPHNNILLDLTPQVFNTKDFSAIKGLNYYWSKFVWEKVMYCDGLAFLGDTRFESQFISNDISLKNTDYVVINTEKHEEKTHVYHVVYDAQVVNREGKVYKY